jgi:hypothetical protein
MAIYMLHNRVIAHEPYGRPMWDEVREMGQSAAFVCPTCGDLWARIIIPTAEWLPVRAGCRHHPWIHPVGGSFIFPWRKTYQDLPVEVLTYEFLLHHDHYLKELT